MMQVCLQGRDGKIVYIDNVVAVYRSVVNDNYFLEDYVIVVALKAEPTRYFFGYEIESCDKMPNYDAFDDEEV